MLQCWLFLQDGQRLISICFCVDAGCAVLVNFYALFNCYIVVLLVQIREQGQQKGESSPYLTELLRLEEQAKQEGLGRWSKVRI